MRFAVQVCWDVNLSLALSWEERESRRSHRMVSPG